MRKPRPADPPAPGGSTIAGIDRDLQRIEKQRRSGIVAALAASALVVVVLLGGTGAWLSAEASAKAERERAASTALAPVPIPETLTVPSDEPAPQRVRIAIGDAGFEPAVVRARSGAPLEVTVARGDGCAAGFLMPSLGIARDNSAGPVTIRLAALEPGTYRFTCGMEMVEGSLIVR